jgi:hypothetical protein
MIGTASDRLRAGLEPTADPEGAPIEVGVQVLASDPAKELG